MMRALFASVCVLALVACDQPQRSPVAPQTPIAPSSIPTYTISGSVRTDGNVLVAGARVVVLGQDSTAATTTDGDGRYSISGVGRHQTEGMSPLLSAAKPGYFTDVEFADSSYRPISRDTTLDFTLHPWVPIELGEVCPGSVTNRSSGLFALGLRFGRLPTVWRRRSGNGRSRRHNLGCALQLRRRRRGTRWIVRSLRRQLDVALATRNPG